MKHITVTFALALLCWQCSSNKKSKKGASEHTAVETKAIDSLKWLFYAYTFHGKAAFSDSIEIHTFKPVECEIQIDTTITIKDSLLIKLRYQKDPYRYDRIIDGLPIGGFVYAGGVARPLTGPVILDSFQVPGFVKKHNLRMDSLFKLYLQKEDTSKLTRWLLFEAKKRGVLK